MAWVSVVETDNDLADAERHLTEVERAEVVDVLAQNPTLSKDSLIDQRIG
jgi:hypothetical protein